MNIPSKVVDFGLSRSLKTGVSKLFFWNAVYSDMKISGKTFQFSGFIIINLLSSASHFKIASIWAVLLLSSCKRSLNNVTSLFVP